MPENNLETYPNPFDGQNTPEEMKTFFDPNLSVEARINAALGLPPTNRSLERPLSLNQELIDRALALHDARLEHMIKWNMLLEA